AVPAGEDVRAAQHGGELVRVGPADEQDRELVAVAHAARDEPPQHPAPEGRGQRADQVFEVHMPNNGMSGCELDGNYVTVRHGVFPPLEPKGPSVARCRVSAGVDERLPPDHLGAYEPTLDVGMDLAGGVPGGQAAAQVP